MGKAFFSKKDAFMRLHGTICIYDGKPVYCLLGSEDGDFVLQAHDPAVYGQATGKTIPKLVEYTDEKFVYKSPLLGYMFVNNQAVYVTRFPDRKQSQGLVDATLLAGGKRFSHRFSVCSQSFVDCVLGNYPSYDAALQMVTQGSAISVPFSRRLAISTVRRNVISLLYRDKPIAVKDGDSFRLFEIKENKIFRKLIEKEVPLHA